MKVKLTLSIEKSVLEDARAHLKEEGKNLSRTFEEYLKKLISQARQSTYLETDETILPKVAELRGIFKTGKEDSRDYKERLRKELQKKYGSHE